MACVISIGIEREGSLKEFEHHKANATTAQIGIKTTAMIVRHTSLAEHALSLVVNGESSIESFLEEELELSLSKEGVGLFERSSSSTVDAFW